MICPHQMNKNGRIWELLHINKEKNGILHKTEPVTQAVLKKYFPHMPEEFSSLLNKFSEKNIKATRQEMAAAAGKMGSDWFNNSFERGDRN